jgi:NADPH-dependent glutamate synthase beta subunit-like oxidoreductase
LTHFLVLGYQRWRSVGARPVAAGKRMPGPRVIVCGGGNAAMDVAGAARRVGAEPNIVYRRMRDKMPARDFEVEHAIEERVMMKWLSIIKHTVGGNIRIEKMELDANALPVQSRLWKRDLLLAPGPPPWPRAGVACGAALTGDPRCTSCHAFRWRRLAS